MSYHRHNAKRRAARRAWIDAERAKRGLPPRDWDVSSGWDPQPAARGRRSDMVYRDGTAHYSGRNIVH